MMYECVHSTLVVSPVYIASSLGWPLVVITFLHRLYLPKLLYVVRTYFHARSTTNHNRNLHTRFLTALSQYYLILSGHFLVTSQTLLRPIMTFHGSLNNKRRALSGSL